MYGMVNEGIRTFIENNFGADAWRSICDDADIEMTQFDRLGSYDDSVTYSLVGAVAKHTDLSTEKVLNVLTAFGCHVVQGFLFSRPVEASSMGKWLRAWQDLTASNRDEARLAG